MSIKGGQFIKSYKIMYKYVKQQIICFFFLYREHGLTFMVGLICKKLLLQKAPPKIFNWVLNTALGNTVKRSSQLKDISPVM